MGSDPGCPPAIAIIGSYVSPYVRKVLACLALKQLDYRIDSLPPFFGNEEFTRLSPLRRVPVLIDDRVTLRGSTVIAQYLDDRYPDRYLEAQVPADGFLFDRERIGVADVSLAAPFRNLGFARQCIDAGRWPRSAAFVDRCFTHPALSHLRAFEERQVRTPIAEQRAVLAAMDARLSETSWAADAPRRGPMTR